MCRLLTNCNKLLTTDYYRKERLGRVHEEVTYTNTQQVPGLTDKEDRLDPNNKLYSIPQKHNNSSNKQISKDIDKIKTLSLNRPPPQAQGPKSYQSGVFWGEDSIHRLSSINRNNSLNPFLSEGIFLDEMYENAPNLPSRQTSEQNVKQPDRRTDERTDTQQVGNQVSEDDSDLETSTFSSSYTYTSSSNNVNSSERSASRSNFDSKDTNDSKLNKF